MADYTTVARVKQNLHASLSADDDYLALLVTAASRAWDRAATGVPDAEDYFFLEEKTDEVLEGLIDRQGDAIICYPHKPIITAVSSFVFQSRIIDTEYTTDTDRIDTRGPRVIAYPANMPLDFPAKCRVTMTYTGGLAVSGSGMPADMQDAVAILATRFYREAEGGLTDQIGVAELGTMVYTKAWPIRVKDTLEYYKRRVGWRHTA